MRTHSIAAVALVLLLSGGGHARGSAITTASCPTLEIAEVATADTTGARRIPTADGDTIAVEPAPLVSTGDVVDARPAMAEGHQVLEVDLDAAAAARLQDFSASHVATRLAFIVDGRARNVARILDPIHGEGLIIDPVEASEATALAQCVHAHRGS